MCQGRLLYFYGLGVSVAANNDRHDEFKFEATLLSQFQPEFSAYTLKVPRLGRAWLWPAVRAWLWPAVMAWLWPAVMVWLLQAIVAWLREAVMAWL